MAGNRDFDFLKGIRLTLPNSDVIRRLSAMANIHSGWNKRLERLNEPFQAASKLLRSFDRSMAPFTATLRRLEEESEKCERLEAAGWLPHETMPFDELEDQTLAGDALDEIVDRHYRINWASAKASFLEFIESCALDEEKSIVARWTRSPVSRSCGSRPAISRQVKWLSPAFTAFASIIDCKIISMPT